MTIEEKAKAYDKALKTASVWYALSDNEKGVLRKIFPELAESEDGRIREWLINLVKSHTEWLEDRIKEQLSNGQIYGGELNKAKDAIVWLEKQDKKPIKIGSKNAVGKLGELMEKQGYDYFNADIKQKDYAEKQNTNDGFHPLIVEEIDLWIKENENVHHNDKNIIGVMRDMAFQVSALTKNLYNQNQWKPSDKQMGALANACDGKILNLDYLNSLYQDLKKLKNGE